MLFGLIDAVNVVCLYSSVSAVNMQCYMLYAVQREECEGVTLRTSKCMMPLDV